MRYYSSREDVLKEKTEQFQELPESTRKVLEKENPRKEVKQSQRLYSSSWPQVVKEVKEFAKKWKKTVDEVSLDHYQYDDYGGPSSALDLEVNGDETDLQYYARLLETHEHQVHRDEWDRQEFERLKGKFGK